MTGMEPAFKSARITLEFYDGTERTVELYDDPEGIRLEGEVTLVTEPRRVESDLPWAVYEPGTATGEVRLSGLRRPDA